MPVRVRPGAPPLMPMLRSRAIPDPADPASRPSRIEFACVPPPALGIGALYDARHSQSHAIAALAVTTAMFVGVRAGPAVGRDRLAADDRGDRGGAVFLPAPGHRQPTEGLELGLRRLRPLRADHDLRADDHGAAGWWSPARSTRRRRFLERLVQGQPPARPAGLAGSWRCLLSMGSQRHAGAGAACCRSSFTLAACAARWPRRRR